MRVAWEGDPHGLHSLAIVNRALCRALLDRGHDIRLIWDSAQPGRQSKANELHSMNGWPRGSDLGRRAGPAAGLACGHQWPPNLEPTAEGRWVLMQPWELAAYPKTWLPALQTLDEVWAYSRSVRDCYLDAGMPESRVQIIPLGVDPEVFRPGLEPLTGSGELGSGDWGSPGGKFRFLFVGGTIFRKGIDVLLGGICTGLPAG